MATPNDVKELTQLFARLGARDPEAWASSQVTEGIDQLHRFLFLRQAWSSVLTEQSTDWIAAHIAQATTHPRDPYSGVGLALARCMDKGVEPQDLTDIVRGMQAELLFSLCYLLDDPSLSEEGTEGVGWCLVATDEDFVPTDRQINGLHESVLETDPTGREMRPRDA